MRGIDFNLGWKFTLEEFESPHLSSCDDSTWRNINLPHDWSVEMDFDKEKGEGCTGYLLGGIGWYRKTFKTIKDMKDKEVWIAFDGIYNRSNIYINGILIEFHPYGYSPLNLNITQYLNDIGEDNLISVKVDHSRYADSRWYTGSGIYRKVSMYILPKVNIPIWGTFIKINDIEEKNAYGQADITISNTDLLNNELTLQFNIENCHNEIVYNNEVNVNLNAEKLIKIEKSFSISNPILWNIFEGNQYTMNIKLFIEGKEIQEYKTKFGIRECKFDVNNGFFINGKNTLIKGVCLHHDAGLVGAAVPLDVWKRRLLKLKECGCNAIRTAHNPASEDFLDLCDELGFLVQEEFYDEWDNPKDKRFNGNEKVVDYITRGHHEFFKEYAKRDLQNTILRDRNHPCIFQWSIGNEIEWTYPKYNNVTGYFGAKANGNYFWTLPPYSASEIRERIKMLPMDKYEIGSTAKKLSKWTKELDETRPVIANCILPSASYESGYTEALDIVGFSYRQIMYDRAHIDYPNKPILGTENVGQWQEWKQVLDRPFISGMFIWTGFDYMGEAGHKDVWPTKASAAGLLNLASFEKPSYYMFKSLWREKPTIHIATQVLEKSIYKVDCNGELQDKIKDGWKRRLWRWHDVNDHWNYNEKDEIAVEIYSNCDSITLYLNNKELGEKHLKDFEDRIYKWFIPFEKGVLKAIGKKDGKVIEESILTSGEIEQVLLTTDKKSMSSGLDSVAHIVAQLQDKDGNPVSDRECEIEFAIDGNAKYLGVDNGHVSNIQRYQSNKITTKNGKALFIVQGVSNGNISISLSNKKSNKVNIKVY